MILRKVNEIKKDKIEAGEKTYRQILISSNEAPNFAMRKFTIEPGGFMPLHKNSVEHEQYVVGGKAEVQIGEKTFLVQKDDVVFIPEGVEHNYRTIGDVPFEFLCLVPNKEDKITIS